MSVMSTLGHPARMVLLTEDSELQDAINAATFGHPELKLVSYTPDPHEMELLLREMAPDVCLVDHSLVREGGVQVAERLAKAFPDVWVFLLTDSPSRQLWAEASARGVRRVVVKPKDPHDRRALAAWVESELLAAVRATIDVETEQRRQMERWESRQPERQVRTVAAAPLIVPVWTAKGGVGKTTISVNLALLAQTNPFARVQTALVDFEEGAGGTHVLLGMPSTPTVLDWEDHAGDPELDRAAMEKRVAHHKSGLTCVFQPDELWQSMRISGELAGTVLRTLRAAHGLVVVDCSPTLTDAVGTALEMASVILLVVEPTKAALYKTQQVLNDLARSDRLPLEKFRVVVNKLPQRSLITEAEVATTLGLTSLGAIPFDPAVDAAQNRSQPLAIYQPNGPFMVALRRIAAKVIPELGPAGHGRDGRAAERGGGLLSRLLGR
ncbi:MAG: AAA family ATPase [Bacillota bacterium]|nr:AAA family ATPase [Bacillota bacterium]